MKRFLVGILGIFLLFGASLLTACGKDKPRLTLSQDTVAIQLYSENEDSGYQIVTADLSGVKEGSIRATVASGYENIVKITTTNSSSTRTSIKIEGLEEGNAQIVVKATPGDITKYIYVTVYSEVSSMSQVVEESGKKNNFLVLGEDNILDENKLISFYPVKGRKTITWSLHDNYVDNPALELNGNVLHIDDTFVGDGEDNTLTLVAKTEKDVMTEVTLPVIKKINAEFSLGFSYSKNSSFENITAENNEFNIVPNIPTDDKYEGYILVGYTGNLEIKSYVLDENGNESNDLQVLSAGIIDNMPLYSVYASKDKSNINGNYKIGFRIGYAKYNYYLDTIDSYPINIKAREMVNGIIVSTTEVGNIGNSTQTLYTSYVESSSTSVNGKRYDISITPTTVIDATNKYSISVSRTVAGGAVSDGCPVEVWYRDALNGDAWTQIVLVPSSNGDYVTREEDLPSVKTLYLKASSKIKDQTVDGFRMTFTSADNTNISTSFDLKLVKSVSLGEFAFDNANFRVDSSVSSVVSKKQFTLKGQTSIEGLYIINNSTNVVFDPIREVSFDAESVTFEVSFVLTKTGITSKDTYQIAHRNGLVAGPFDIDIFLPLKFAGMFLDSGENQSNSVIDSALNNKVYTTGGLVADDSQIASLSKLILKNNTTTPLLYTYNSIAGKSAVADISVAFFDYDSELETLEQFQGLMSSPEGINRVIRGAIEKGDSSNIAYFNSNYSAILTKGVGHTYAVISFTGKGIENVDEDGNVVFVRVVYLESLVTPEGFNVVPESDKNISLYSLNTVATEDEELTRKQITIKFVKSDITYKDLSNLEFVSRSTLMGNQEVSPDRGTVTWSDGRYSISNITINGEGISFNVLALDTFGDDIFTDTLSLHYMVKDLNGKKIYDIFIPFSIVIRNAQRVESITWKSYREDGLYFEVGNKEPQYVLIDTAPINAKNTNLAYIIKAEGSGNSNTFVEVNPTVSSTTLAINLSDKITKGMSGYVYILPADAIYNHQIKYYYMEGGKEKSGTISDNDLPNNYEYLVANAYFKSNATGGDAKIVKFADILIRIKVQVADGKSFDYAYRIYDVDSFVSMRHDRYYTIMNDIDLTNATERGVDASSSLTGGIQGKNDTITIKLDGSNLAKVLGSNGIVDSSAEIRNITFVGNVTGGGFVAEENKGKITNVTVDVNGTKASTLVSTTSVGGIVGTNNGTISGVSVLGLDINADGQNVGGIAGVNNGTITGSRVEFYNLEKDSEYASNKFYGANVGGIVGVIGNGSKIERTYAYDYTLVPRYNESSNASQNALQNVLKSSQSNGGVGAFAGRYANNFTNAVINYSFSVVNAMVNVGGSSQNGLTTTSTYISYYTGLNYNTTASQNDINFVKENETGFKSYVNNGNPHLKELMQDEPVSSVAGYDVVSYSDNGFYKSLAVNEVVEERGKGLLFRYDILNESNELSSSEQIDLDALNTITLADLVGEQNVSRNIIVTSSNSSIVKVVGSTLQILKNGSITLTISSKQDVKNKKEIDVNVIYALSDLMISWASASGKVSYVEDETTLILQKTHSRTYITNLENSQIYLGNLAKAFEIKPNNGSSLNIKLSGDDKNKLVKIDESNVTNAGFRVITDTNSIQTRFIVSPKIYNEENAYQKAIETQFKRTFTIDPIDGVILFNISGDALPITPSTNATLEVQIKTTQENDTVYPVIEYNDTKLVSTPVEKNIYNYTLPSQSTPIFTATINKIDSLPSKDTESNLKTYVYLITFAVNADYQSLVSEDMEFNVYIMSESGNSSRDWNGEFKLSLTRQNFTNIDVSNRKITNSSYRYEEGGSGKLVEVHEANLPTSVLAPGNSSVLQINVNPEFAYYDYVDLSYSDATVSEAVNMEVLTKYGNDLFTRKPLSGNNIETIGSALRYYPEIGEKGTLYYKLWINTTVNRDSVLKFTAKFYEAGGKLITYVNYYLTVSYLTEPKVTIDDATTSYVAKGSNATVKIDVLIDQKIDNLLLDGEDMSGISLAPQGEPVPDLEKGIKTYTTTLYVSPTATVKNNLCYVQAEVSRELNGSKEKKTAVATAVIVDFKVDGNNIVFDNSADGNVTIWQGVTKPISINYNLIPENYPNASDEDTEAAINDLREKRKQFTSSQLYPVKITSDENNIVYEPISGDELDNYNYFVNYRYNKIGNDIYDDNKDDNVLIPLKLRDRLYVVSGNNRYPLVEKDSEIDIPFVPIYDDETNTVSFRGIRQSSPVTLVLMTYISAGGFTQEIETFFNVTVDAYSDPDIPLLVKNAKDFKNLAPGQNTSTSVQDYILTSDIVLQNYTAFDTSLIRSLDGNGHTIFIDSFNTDDTGVLNLALFTTVREDTTLKNIRVNLYNGGQLSIDTSVHKEINIAGLAIENEGVITNCEVVSFYTNATAKGDVEGVDDFNYPAISVKHNNPTGINVEYTNGMGSDPIKLVDASDWTSQVAGFVINNMGSITNSRVGGDSVIIIGEDKVVNGEPTGYTYASSAQLDTFNIIGQGNISGFVISNNNGNIAACFAKNINMVNESDSTSFYSTGFVGTNTSTINVSYVEGVPSEPSDDKNSGYSVFANEGSSISSEKGYISGFAYSNEGTIKDSYSNILIASAEVSKKVYLASGFVYSNSGVIENGYSASQIKNSTSTQMNFSGVNNKGELLADGEYINCYFFNKLYEGSEESSDNSTETQNSTGAMLVPMPDEASSFYGFAIANSDNDGVWKIEDGKGITLVSANTIATSHRYVYYVDDSIFQGSAAEDDKGKYILPYAILTFTDENREIDTSLGGYNNPIIIVDAQDFVEVTGTTTSSYIKKYFNNTAVWGTYRLVNDINLQDVASGDNVVILPTATKAFSGNFYGNGFTISGLSISSVDPATSLGLFRSIEKRGKLSNPIVENLNIEVTQIEGTVVVMTGALAGYIKDAVVINIDIQFAENATVTGLNFVGGLSGFVFGNNIIKCINVENPNVIAKANPIDDNRANYFISDESKSENSLQNLRIEVINSLNLNTSVESEFIKNLKNYSYAGGVIGFADLFSSNDSMFDILQSENFNINNVRVSGTVRVEGQIAGGAFGLTGYQTNIRDVGVTIDGGSPSKIFSTRYFAGGVIGQSFGSISRVYSVYDETTQDEIENGMADFYNGNYDTERGNLDIFYTKGTDYTQQYIGGIAGAAFSGNIEVSYSKLNVTSPTATYAGGIFGALDISKESAYQETVDEGKLSFTGYYINEVFATGDVRANIDGNGFAGGIIGLLVGGKSTALFNSVNAFNYFTAYDYKSETYQEEIVQDNFSELYKFNSLVGHFATQKDGILSVDETVGLLIEKTDEKENKYLDIDTGLGKSPFTNYINFVIRTANDSDVPTIPTVGYYEGYYRKDEKIVTVNLFGKVNGIVSTIENPLLRNYMVYAIESPSAYTNSLAGSQYTNIGFLGSGVWSYNNWEHKTGKLFLSIKYKRSSNIIYLDAYDESIEAAFSCTGYETIYIRGLVSPGSERYSDINLIDYYKKYSKKLNGFAGRLRGGIYPLESSKKVKIITDQPFIEYVNAGFKAIDVEVEYKTANPTTEPEISLTGSSSGLFIANSVGNIEIDGLTMDIKSPIKYKVSNNTNDLSIGLVAPELRHANLKNINIISTEGTLLTISPNGEIGISSDSQLNVGLVAGIVEQDSPVSNMNVIGINISSVGNLMWLDTNIGFNNVNVGTYFGVARKTKEAINQEFNVSVTDLVRPSISGERYNVIMFSDNKPIKNLNLGGYIGAIGNTRDGEQYLGLNSFSIAKEEINTNLLFNIGCEVTNLNIGGYVGIFNTTSNFTVSGRNSNLDLGLIIKSDHIIGSLKAGGIIGLTAQNTTTVHSLNVIEFGVIGYSAGIPSSTKLPSQKESLNGSYKEDANVKIGTSAYIGGVVGYQSSGTLKVSNIKSINSKPNKYEDANVTMEDAVNSFRVEGNGNTKVYMGSVLGSFEGNKLEIFENSTFTSYTEFMVKNTGTEAYVGGLVGKANISEDSSIKPDSSSTAKSRYFGAVYSNTKYLTFGGVIGEINVSSTINTDGSVENGSFTIRHTSFGGVVKIYGENSETSEIIAGGTVGSTISDSTWGNVIQGLENSAIILENNYNFGDVFVEYSNESNFTKLNTYNFGGLIGNITLIPYFIINNYTLTTSHNAKYSTTTNTAHALYGGEGVPVNTAGTEGINYYNHAIVLANDENGYDLPLFANTEYNGYNYDAKKDSEGILNKFVSESGTVSGEEYYSGHKLSLQEIKEGSSDSKYKVGTLEIDGVRSFHGIKYYAMSEKYNVIYDDKDDSAYNNIAIIGAAGYTFTNEFTISDSTSAMIEKLSGYSFVSGFALEVNMTYTGELNTRCVSTLIGEMNDNSILYAVNVKGTLDFAKTFVPSNEQAGGVIVSGLVGILNSGRIFDCSTDIDIIYRGSKNVSGDAVIRGVFGITSLNNNDTVDNGYRIIENTYSAGSIKTYSSTNVFAFTNYKSLGKDVIKNCYAIPKFDLNDYTNEDNSLSGAIITVFGSDLSSSKCYYDKDALNYNITDSGNKKLDNFMNGTTVDNVTTYNPNTNFNTETGMKWVSDYSFNYGYPTLKYGYLKVSSYAMQTSSRTKLERLAEEKNKDINSYIEGFYPNVDNKNNKTKEDMYDNYIIENEYKRLPNGEKPNADNNYTYKYIAKGEDGKDQSREKDCTCYFIITNPSLFTKMNTINEGGQFVLKYDLDLKYEDAKPELLYMNDAYSSMNFTGILDANNKNISNLTTSLFRELGKSSENGKAPNTTKIMNLNLKITANKNSLLADKAENTLISNIAITGDLNAAQGALKVGGFVQELKNSEINTSTSMINISAKNNNQNAAVGGFAGVMSGNSKILFSSNYGPINIISNESGKTTAAGGLVGLMSSGKDDKNIIRYSYNTASVINNYATNSETCKTQGLFFSGGLVGYMLNGTIENSYNSGIVKSGNKTNTGGDKSLADKIFGEIKIAGVDIACHMKISSFAGGITAYGATGSVNNCYNEGNVEALGKNPSTDWTWDKDSNLVLSQTSEQNVFAYSIGYFAKQKFLLWDLDRPDVALKNLTSVIPSRESNAYDSKNVYANGASLGNGDPIQTWTWGEIVNTNDLNEEESIDFSTYYENRESIIYETWFRYVGLSFKLKLNRAQKEDQKLKIVNGVATTDNNKKPDIIVKSRDDLGIPVNFVLKIVRNVQISHTGWSKLIGFGVWVPYFQRTWSNRDGLKNENLAKFYFSDLYIGEVENKDNESVNLYTYKTYSEDSAKVYNSSDSTNITLYDDASNDESINNFKSTTRSRAEENTDKISTIMIAGETYLIADQNNTSVFNAGISTRTGSITLSTKEIPYISNLSYYSIDAGSDISAVVTKITPIKNSTNNNVEQIKIDYSLLSQSEIVSPKLTIKLDYEQLVDFNLSKLSYYYESDYSFAFDSNLNPHYLKNHILKDKENNSYDKVIRISKTEISSLKVEESELAKNDNNKFIYLAVKEGKYIYIPYAKLTNSDESNKVVNIPLSENGSVIAENDLFNYSDKTDAEKDAIFARDVQKLIKGFIKNGPYYNRVYSGIDFYNDAIVSPSLSLNEEGIGGEKTTSRNDKYGEKLAGDLVISNISRATLSNKKVIVEFNSFDKNIVGIDNNSSNYGVISYNKSANSWNFNNNYTINGVNYTKDASDKDSITLKKSDGSNISDSEKTSIENYFKTTISYIKDTQNGTNPIVIHSSVLNGGEICTPENIGLSIKYTVEDSSGKDAYVYLKGNHTLSWEIGGKSIGTTPTTIGNLTIKASDSYKNSIEIIPNRKISHGGVSLYYIASQSINIKEKLQGEITNIHINKNSGLINQYKIQMSAPGLNPDAITSNFEGKEWSTSYNLNYGNNKFNVMIDLFATINKKDTDSDEVLLGVQEGNNTFYIKASNENNERKTIVSEVYKLISGNDITVGGQGGKGNAFLLKRVETEATYTTADKMRAASESQFSEYTYKDKETKTEILYNGQPLEKKAKSVEYFVSIIENGTMYDFSILLYRQDEEFAEDSISEEYKNAKDKTGLDPFKGIENPQTKPMIKEYLGIYAEGGFPKGNNIVQPNGKVYIPNFDKEKYPYSGLLNDIKEDTDDEYTKTGLTSMVNDLKTSYIDFSHIEALNNFSEKSILKNKELLKTGLYSTQIEEGVSKQKEVLYLNTNELTLAAPKDIRWLGSNENGTTTLSSLIITKDVKYVKFNLNEYKIHTKSFKINSYDYILKVDDDFDPNYNWESQKDKIKYTQSGNSFTVYLKSFNAESFKIRASVHRSVEKTLEIEENPGGLAAQDIILTRNIIFDTPTTFAKNKAVNIIGNGHYISFFGRSFYTTANCPSDLEEDKFTWIRDVAFLGDVYGSNSFFTKESKDLMPTEAEKENKSPSNNLKNRLVRVSFYGSISNYQENADGKTSQAALINNKMLLKEFKTFVNISKAHSNEVKYKDVYLFTDILTNEGEKVDSNINYGLIVADYGDNGISGASGMFTVRQYNDSKGTNGDNGGSILTTKTIKEFVTTDNQLKIEGSVVNIKNNGILVSGLGGSGGAGGSSLNGGNKYIDVTVGSVNQNYGSAGYNGKAFGFTGDGGDSFVINRVTGRKENSSTNINGQGLINTDFRSQSGAAGRASFGKIVELMNTSQKHVHAWWGPDDFNYEFAAKSLTSREKGEGKSHNLRGEVGVPGGVKIKTTFTTEDINVVFSGRDNESYGIFNLDAPNGITYGVRYGVGLEEQGTLNILVCLSSDFDSSSHFYGHSYKYEPSSGSLNEDDWI